MLFSSNLDTDYLKYSQHSVAWLICGNFEIITIYQTIRGCSVSIIVKSNQIKIFEWLQQLF